MESLVENYGSLETLKMNLLKNRVEQTRKDIKSGRVSSDSEYFFADLLNGKFD